MTESRLVNQDTIGIVVPLVGFLCDTMDFVTATQQGLFAMSGKPAKLAPSADAAKNCFAVMESQMKSMIERQTLDGMDVLLSLAQDTCRRSIWFINLLIEHSDSMRVASLRAQFQHALDESFAG